MLATLLMWVFGVLIALLGIVTVFPVLGVYGHVITIALFLCFAAFPLSRNQLPAAWAKAVAFGIGIVGALQTLVRLALAAHWVSADVSSIQWIKARLHFLDGILLGFVLALIISGQLTGPRIGGKVQ